MSIVAPVNMVMAVKGEALYMDAKKPTDLGCVESEKEFLDRLGVNIFGAHKSIYDKKKKVAMHSFEDFIAKLVQIYQYIETHPEEKKFPDIIRIWFCIKNSGKAYFLATKRDNVGPQEICNLESNSCFGEFTLKMRILKDHIATRRRIEEFQSKLAHDIISSKSVNAEPYLLFNDQKSLDILKNYIKECGFTVREDLFVNEAILPVSRAVSAPDAAGQAESKAGATPQVVNGQLRNKRSKKSKRR